MDKNEGNNKTLIIVLVVAIIIVGVAAFYGGTVYAGSKRLAGTFGQGNFAGRSQGAGTAMAGARQGGQAGGGIVNGEVLSLDDKSVTIKSRQGGSKIIFFSSSTEIGKFVSGVLSDVVVGSNVMVSGKTNADGSITAQSIQLRPAGIVGGPGGAGAPNDQPQTPPAR